jgi:predicted enzyme related to lactoylglutathione lyase
MNPNTGCPVIHFEIGCTDTTKTNTFYTTIFGWSGTPSPMASFLATNSDKGIQGHNHGPWARTASLCDFLY